MNLLQNAVRSSSTHLTRNINPNLGLRSFLSGSPSLRQFSTESSPPTNQPSTKPFFETPSGGLVYGRLLGITNNTLKSDVLSLLEECNLSTNDLKVDYNPSYSPTGMIVQFSSRSAYDAALRAVTRKGRLYRLERADRANWDYIQPYGGKFVLMQGIPPNASLDDIERFLDGCEYDPSNIRMFSRLGSKMAVVPFLSPTAAMSAMITKNRGFCFNNQISMHVLQFIKHFLDPCPRSFSALSFPSSIGINTSFIRLQFVLHLHDGARCENDGSHMQGTIELPLYNIEV